MQFASRSRALGVSLALAVAVFVVAGSGAQAASSSAALADVRVRVAGEDDTTYDAAFPRSVSDVVTAEAPERLHVSARVLDAEGSAFSAQQVFLRLRHKESGEETVHVMKDGGKKKKAGTAGSFTVSVPLGDDERNQLGRRSGSYALDVIVGDSRLSNGLVYHLADADIALPLPIVAADPPLYHRTLTHESDTTLKALPEIHHQFRSPESRPPAVVSRAFTALIAGLFVAFIAALFAVGVNMRGLPSGAGFLWAAGFHASLAALLLLCLLYWLQLNMFQTLGLMVPVAAATAAFGHRLLRQLDPAELLANTKSD